MLINLYALRTDSRILVNQVSKDIDEPEFQELITTFLSEHVNHNTILFDCLQTPTNTTSTLLLLNQPITVYPSALATFYAPSDICGTGGMRSERIRAIPAWRGGPGRYDCVLIRDNPDQLDGRGGFRSYSVGRVRLFFTFTMLRTQFSCALVHNYSPIDDHPDENTGMWIVQRATSMHRPQARVIPLDLILRAVHLIPVYGYEKAVLGKTHAPEHSLDDFEWFYVNKFVDHHAYEVLF